MRLYCVGGLSYGNLSARKDGTRFWMSASGVDKSKLESVGRDILMVKDFDDDRGVIVLSVPPGIEPRRVSVDAIEHWMIYQAHPDVGAILHVHAWMEGIAATDVNYPCGTQQLAVAVADLVAQEPDPAHAVIGLRNHGLTCTGDSLSEILDRVAPKVLRQSLCPEPQRGHDREQRRDHDVVRHAPDADGVDDGQLQHDQIRAECESDEGEHRGAEPRGRRVPEDQREHDRVRDEPEQRRPESPRSRRSSTAARSRSLRPRRRRAHSAS